MEKTVFEKMGGTYTQQDDYRLPNLFLPAEEECAIGVWVQRMHNTREQVTSADDKNEENGKK